MIIFIPWNENILETIRWQGEDDIGPACSSACSNNIPYPLFVHAAITIFRAGATEIMNLSPIRGQSEAKFNAGHLSP